jgi:hypothetical protein
MRQFVNALFIALGIVGATIFIFYAISTFSPEEPKPQPRSIIAEINAMKPPVTVVGMAAAGYDGNMILIRDGDNKLYQYKGDIKSEVYMLINSLPANATRLR